MRLRRAMQLGTLMSALMALTLVGVAPATAQGPEAAAEECRGGGPDYWLANPWPAAFVVPKLFRMPSGKSAVVRKWTRFDSAFRYRGGRDNEGRIFPGKTMKQVLQAKGTLKKGLGRQTVAALLNAAVGDNHFPVNKYWVIRDFQVYWDGTDDLGLRKSRQHMKGVMIKRNAKACPPPA